MIPRAVAVPGLDRVGLNPWVLGFSLVASLAAAVVFSTVACVGIARDAHSGALVAQRRTTMTRRAPVAPPRDWWRPRSRWRSCSSSAPA